ncbi:galectin-9 [Apteryx mantelli]|uniref:Galectin n=1 Tax=Apteryx mantelli TaxID=2696672 RepID=A0ABM4FM73_9AVES|nr:galectin-9 [Apteryx rowi]
MTQYVKPSIPFTGTIPDGLQDNMLVTVTGSVLQTGDRFSMNFQCGTCQSPRADIAFHFNPRFEKGGYIVCNSLQKDRWGKEERKYEMPFAKGQPFEIQILFRNEVYMVTVNGKHLLDYKSRIPFSRVDTITVSENVDLELINFEVFASLPPGPLYDINLTVPSGPFQPPHDYTMPYSVPVSGGIYPTKNIIISGTIPPSAKRFHVNLKAGEDIALHVNPRFEEKVIVRNTLLNRSWGKEERSLPSKMPLSQGQNFSIWIYCDAQCFKMATNGQHQFDYKHRIPNLQQIDTLEVCGDVTLTQVQV